MSDSDITKTMEFLLKGFPIVVSKNQHTQLGVHFEEIAEMLECIKSEDNFTQKYIENVQRVIVGFSAYLKREDNVIFVPVENREDFLDSICDQLVTAVGVGYVNNVDIVGGFGEVNRSNLSKFDNNGNPILDNNMKLIKGPNYYKANLKPFV